MAKQDINIGSAANDGTGDPLRTAFDKINDNFGELYAVSAAGSGNNIAISGQSIISENTNGNITLDPNGTGKVVIATAAGLRFTDHTDNAIAYVDADGDVQFNSKLIWNNTTATFQAEDVTIHAGTISTANSNQDLTIDPSGTGSVNITGHITVSGSTTLNGSLRTAIHTFTATDAVTSEEHAGRTLLLGEVGGNALVTLTLPAATGSGNIYKFIVSVVNTSNYVIKVADATDTIDGQVIVQNDSTEGGTASVIGWKADGTDDTITLNGTTTGGASIGDYVELIDIAANQYTVSGLLQASGTEATPFSATVS